MTTPVSSAREQRSITSLCKHLSKYLITSIFLLPSTRSISLPSSTMKILALIFVFLPQFALAANILFLNMWNSKSHFLSMKAFAERLVEKGNNVSIYTAVRKTLGPSGKGVRTIETILSPNQPTSDMGTVAKTFWYFELKPQEYVITYQIGYEYLSFCIGDETFQKVMNTAYDLVIADELFPSSQAAMALKLKEKFGTKFASIATTDISSIFNSYRAISRNPVVTPNHYTKGYEMHNFKVENFLGRMKTVWDSIAEQYFINIVSNEWMTKAGKLLGIKSTLKEFFEGSHLTFMDFPSRYGFPASSTNNFIYVGEHCQEGKELPPNLREFVEDPSSRGTIYIAFGSVVNWEVAPTEVIATFFAALNTLTKYRVIFSYSGPTVKDLKPHIKVVKWAPQNDILSHNKTILFFTHGGLKSVKEGICTETAMLFLPFFADQPRNALFAQKLGIAEAIYKKNITEEELSYKINKVLSDSSYRLQTQKVNRQYLDNVIDPLDYGSHWAGRLVKISDHHSFYYKNRGRLLSWISYLYLDVMLWISLLHFLFIKT